MSREFGYKISKVPLSFILIKTDRQTEITYILLLGDDPGKVTVISIFKSIRDLNYRDIILSFDLTRFTLIKITYPANNKNITFNSYR